MAMPQRDETIEKIKRLDALLEYAVMHEDEAEADRLRAELHRLVEKVKRGKISGLRQGHVETFPKKWYHFFGILCKKE